jgi:hypothetical protein
MVGTVFAVSDNDPNFDAWLATITEASARLDDLQTAVTEVRHLCEPGVSRASKSSKSLNGKAYN